MRYSLWAFREKANGKVYLGLLQKDPFYLFTDVQIEDLLADQVTHFLGPLLVYLHDRFSTPTLLIPGISPLLSYGITFDDQNKVYFPTFSNFTYTTTSTKEDPGKDWESRQLVVDSLNGKCTEVNKYRPTVYSTTLQVQVPEDTSHSYWQSSSAGYSWTPTPDSATPPRTTTITLERWGFTEIEARRNVSQRAMVIITLLRRSVTTRTPPRLQFLSLPPFASNWRSSRQHELARKLHLLWSDCKLFTPRVHGSTDLQDWLSTSSTSDLSRLAILRQEFPEFSTLLDYYEVSPSLSRRS